MLRNCVLLAWMLQQASCELVLLKKGEDAYCVSRNVQDKALAWTVKMDEHVNLGISYNVTGEWSKWTRQDGEFQHINCNPMRSEKCDGWANFDRWTKKIVTWTDDYGLVLDERWNDFPPHIGLNNAPEIMGLPYKNLQKFYINLSVLSKTCVRLMFFNSESTPADPGRSENKYVFEFDCKKNRADNWSLRLLTKNSKSASTESRGKRESAFLNKGEIWTNIQMVYEMKENGFISWKINEEVFTIQNVSSIKEFTHFAIRASSNTFYWRHHSDYRILETSDISSPLEATIEANNERDRELCISIVYLGQGNLTLLTDGATITTVIPSNKENWTTFRHVFNLDRGKIYKLSILPSFYEIGNIRKFSLGYIRVCKEKEYKISKYKEYERNKVIACGVLNETFIRTNMSKQLDSPFVFSCEKGHFGANCDMKCSDIDGLSDCKSVIACSSTSCSCLPGYHGDGCNQDCGPNKYGLNCQDDCGICDEGKECFHSNGSCPGNVCAAGFSGTLCKTPCIGGTYGKNCAYNCSQQCKHGHVFCDATNGICTYGCKIDEFRPPTCDKRIATVTKISLSGNGDESLQIDVNVDFDDVNLLSSYQVQVREQSTTDWKNNTYGSWIYTEKLIKLTVNNLKPKTAYAIRVLLIENDDKFYENKNILYVITSCIPAKAKEDFNVTRDANLKTIEIRLFRAKQSAEHCKLIDYDIYLNGNAIRMDIKTTYPGQVRLEQLQDSIDDIDIKIKQISNPKVYFEFYGNKKRMNGAKGKTVPG